MKVVIREEDEGDRIPSTIHDGVYYSAEEVASAVYHPEFDDDDEGDVLLEFSDGHVDRVYNIDLDYISGRGDEE